MSHRSSLRWVVSVVVLAAAVVIALWPRERPAPGRPSPSAPPGTTALAPLRAGAALDPCPVADAPGPEAVRGVTVTCLAGGERVDAGRAIGPGPVLITVWAPWCAPCRDELPVLRDYAASPGAVRVLGLQVESAEADGLGMLRNIGVRLPSLYDPDGTLSRRLGVPRLLPATFVVGTDGQVSRVDPPTVFTGTEQVRDVVARYLGDGG